MSYWNDVKEIIDANDKTLDDQIRNLYHKHRFLMSKIDLLDIADYASSEFRELVLETGEIELKLYQLMQELNEQRTNRKGST